MITVHRALEAVEQGLEEVRKELPRDVSFAELQVRLDSACFQARLGGAAGYRQCLGASNPHGVWRVV